MNSRTTRSAENPEMKRALITGITGQDAAKPASLRRPSRRPLRGLLSAGPSRRALHALLRANGLRAVRATQEDRSW
jgi:hypothetical protein